jgi:hypothetical protein
MLSKNVSEKDKKRGEKMKNPSEEHPELAKPK